MVDSIINCYKHSEAQVVLLGANYDRTSSFGKGAHKGPQAIKNCLDNEPTGKKAIKILFKIFTMNKCRVKILRKDVHTIWMQEGVVDEVAAAKARAAGLNIIMNMCIMKKHKLVSSLNK